MDYFPFFFFQYFDMGSYVQDEAIKLETPNKFSIQLNYSTNLLINPPRLNTVTFHGIKQMFSQLGGIHSSLTVVVLILLSQINLISYEREVANLCLEQYPEIFKDKSSADI